MSDPTYNTQELDEILNSDDGVLHCCGYYEKEAKRAVLDWHNKQVGELLDRLDKSMPTAEQLTTKYGYYMPEKQFGYKLALHDIRRVLKDLEAEL